MAMNSYHFKALVYSLVGVAAFIIGAAVASLCSEVLLYSLFFGAFSAGFAMVSARVVLHVLQKDYSPEMWQISIYLYAACFGWLGAVLASSWWLVSFCMAIFVAGVVMAVGYRFLKEQGFLSATATEEPIPVENEPAGLTELKASVRFKYLDDDPSKGEDKSRPLCSINGVACTVDEAYSRGWGAVAADGIEYLKESIKKRDAAVDAAKEE